MYRLRFIDDRIALSIMNISKGPIIYFWTAFGWKWTSKSCFWWNRVSNPSLTRSYFRALWECRKTQNLHASVTQEMLSRRGYLILMLHTRTHKHIQNFIHTYGHHHIFEMLDIYNIFDTLVFVISGYNDFREQCLHHNWHSAICTKQDMMMTRADNFTQM